MIQPPPNKIIINGVQYAYIKSGAGHWEIHTPIGLYRMENHAETPNCKVVYYLDDPTGEEGTWEEIKSMTASSAYDFNYFFKETVSQHITDNPIKEYDVLISVSYSNSYTVLATSDDHAETIATRLFDADPKSQDPASNDIYAYAEEKNYEEDDSGRVNALGL